MSKHVLCKGPQYFHTHKENDIYIKNNSDELKEKYKTCININDITIYNDIICDDNLEKIHKYVTSINWKYNYSDGNISDKVNNSNNVELKECCIKYFYFDLYYNDFFRVFFYDYLIDKINIVNKNKLYIDRCFITGQLHGLSGLFHKDERSSNEYGPSIYIFLNKDWKPYYDGSMVFIIDETNVETLHVENIFGRVVVFKPNIYHKLCEISGYGLIENAFSMILEYHTIYK